MSRWRTATLQASFKNLKSPSTTVDTGRGLSRPPLACASDYMCVGAKLRSASGARQLPTTRHTSRAPPLYRSPDGVQASLSRSPPAADSAAFGRQPSGSLQVAFRLPAGCLQVACRLPAGCLQVAFRLPSGVVLRRFFGQGVGRQDDALEQAPHLIAAEARPGPRAVQKYTKWARPGRAVQ